MFRIWETCVDPEVFVIKRKRAIPKGMALLLNNMPAIT